MNAIADAVKLILAERDAKEMEIQALAAQVAGFDSAISALRAISDRDGARLNLKPADDQPERVDQAADTRKTMASIVSAVGTPPPSVGAVSAAEALAEEIIGDLPQLMTKFEHGPSIKDLMVEYGIPDGRAREACRRLHNTNRALFSASDKTGLLHLTPRREKSAA